MSKRGGNRKPQTFKDCQECKTTFGPVPHLKQKFCSKECAYSNRAKRPKKGRWKIPPEIRAAHRRVAYLIDIGTLVRPNVCEQCNAKSYTEASHQDYLKKEIVTWLCRPCHRKYDKQQPKIARWEKYSGKKAELIHEP